MKPRLLISLLLCALLLAACYRQTEDTFQQADSAEAIVVASPTSLEAEAGAELDATDGTPVAYLTPETAPGQVEQPTLDQPTQIVIGATSLSQTLTPFVRPTATQSFEEGLDAAHQCVYTVISGDNLYRLSLAWGTTVEAIMEASQLDSDALAIGQLLLRPGCDYATPTAVAPVSPVPVAVDTATPLPEPEATVDSPPEDTAEAPAEAAAEATPEATAAPTIERATEVPPTPTATPTPSVHVVSAGDTIESISLRYRVDVNELIALNNLANPNQLAVGQELLLPD